MPSLFSSVELLLVSLKPHPLFDITVPHKIFAYMSSGKPVIAATGGEAATLIDNGHAGRSCPPGDASALARTVSEMEEMPRAEIVKMGANGRRIACELYSRTHLTAEVEKVLCGVVRRPRPETQENFSSTLS